MYVHVDVNKPSESNGHTTQFGQNLYACVQPITPGSGQTKGMCCVTIVFSGVLCRAVGKGGRCEGTGGSDPFTFHTFYSLFPPLYSASSAKYYAL